MWVNYSASSFKVKRGSITSISRRRREPKNPRMTTSSLGVGRSALLVNAMSGSEEGRVDAFPHV